MLQDGPENNGLTNPPPPPPPPPPAAPPPPPSAVTKKKEKEEKLSPELEEYRTHVLQQKAALEAQIAKGAKDKDEAELQYDTTRQELKDAVALYNKERVSPLDAQVKLLEHQYDEQAKIVNVITQTAESRLSEITRQLEVLEAQKTSHPEELEQIKSEMSMLSQEQKEIDAHLKKTLPDLEARKNITQKQLDAAKKELKAAIKEKDQLVTISKIFPARTKKKEEKLDERVINFSQWIDNGLLNGVYLRFLKQYIKVKTDIELKRILTNVTNPTRPMGIPLSVGAVLAMASGYITLSKEVAFNEITPLNGCSVNQNRKEALAKLVGAFYQAYPAFKDCADVDAVILDLEKRIQAAAPKATPATPGAPKEEAAPVVHAYKNALKPVNGTKPDAAGPKRELPPPPPPKDQIKTKA